MIIYIGNILSQRGGSVGFIETIVPKLADRYEIKSVSAIKNKIFRLIHMVATIVTHSKRVNVVLIDTFSTQAFWFASIVASVCSMLGVPYISILRGGDFPSRMVKSPNSSARMLNRSALNISPSHFLADKLNELNFPVSYIPNFIDLPLYPFKLRKNVRPRLLWVRAFHRIYNPCMAIEVLREIRMTYPEAELCMVGADTDGSLEKVRRKVEDLDLRNAVKITGRLLKAEWVTLSADYDIFINTTNVDNMPVSVVEAMALGFPIVSTSVGGIPYLIESETNGLLTAPADNRGMVECIKRIVDGPDLAGRLSASARSKAESFDWARISHEWYRVLDKFGETLEK